VYNKNDNNNNINININNITVDMIRLFMEVVKLSLRCIRLLKQWLKGNLTRVALFFGALKAWFPWKCSVELYPLTALLLFKVHILDVAALQVFNHYPINSRENPKFPLPSGKRLHNELERSTMFNA